MKAVLAAVSLNPDLSALPGGAQFQALTNGVGGWALLLCLVALLVSAATWALGANSQNFQYATAGKRGVLVAGLGALVIGAAPALINFFFSTGGAVS